MTRHGARGLAPARQPLVVFGVLRSPAPVGDDLGALITGFAPAPVRNPVEFLRVVVLADQGHLFEIWLALGGVLAAPVFASSVVAIPLLLDREVGVLARYSRAGAW